MYHFYFSSAVAYLPRKASVNRPVIISCYASRGLHWTKRVEEYLRDEAVNKRDAAFISIDIPKEADDERCKKDLADMLDWIKDKKYFNAAKAGLLTFGQTSAIALKLAEEKDECKFSIATIPEEPKNFLSNNFGLENLSSFKKPTLLLRGDVDKVELNFRDDQIKSEEIIDAAEDSKSSAIIFKQGDHCLYNVMRQASDRIYGWLDELIRD